MTGTFHGFVRGVIAHVELPPGLELKIGGDEYLLVEDTTGARGRKWRLSPHMTRSEIVRTAFMATLAFLEHELREDFTYRGARVYSPHLDVEALAEIAQREDRRRGEPGAWEREGEDEIVKSAPAPGFIPDTLFGVWIPGQHDTAMPVAPPGPAPQPNRVPGSLAGGPASMRLLWDNRDQRLVRRPPMLSFDPERYLLLAEPPLAERFWALPVHV